MFDQALIAIALRVQYQRAKPDLLSIAYDTQNHRMNWFSAKHGPSWELWCEAVLNDGSWFNN